MLVDEGEPHHLDADLVHDAPQLPRGGVLGLGPQVVAADESLAILREHRTR